MESGDIILNKFAGHRDARVAVYIGDNKGIVCVDGKIDFWTYPRNFEKEKYHDGTLAFVKVGNINEMIVSELEKYK